MIVIFQNSSKLTNGLYLKKVYTMNKKIKIGIGVLAIIILAIIIFKRGDNNNLKNKTLNYEDAQNRVMEIADKVMSGELSSEEADKLYKEISDNMQSQEDYLKEEYDNVSDFNGIPSWAKSVGIKEPSGLSLIKEESSIIKEDDHYSDSFITVYSGDSEMVLTEAKRITEELNLNVEFEMENVFMSSGKAGKYSVSIAAADNGDGMKMVFSASDLTKFDQTQ